MKASSQASASNVAFSAERSLLDCVERLGAHRSDRLALHVHLSRLQSYHRREHHLRMAISTFDSLVNAHEGQIFVLKNRDIIFIGYLNATERLEEAIIKLRNMFKDDPLISKRENHLAVQSLTSWYLLDKDYDKLLQEVRQLIKITDTGAPSDLTVTDTGEILEKNPITPDKLGWLEDALKIADLSNMVRNQAVCAVNKGVPPVPIFHELYISIGDLESAVTPGIDLVSNRWLFQYLTLTLDKRMLHHLAKEGERSTRAFSFNMNVSTLLSSEFQKFDQQVSSSLRGRLVIELQTIDVFADMAAYMFARDYVMDRGYRVCLDGLTHFTAPYIDRKKMGFDFAKIYWSPPMATADLGRLSADLRSGGEHEQDIGRIIMCRCDDEFAVETGRQLGINLFQGWYIDSLLKQNNKV